MDIEMLRILLLVQCMVAIRKYSERHVIQVNMKKASQSGLLLRQEVFRKQYGCSREKEGRGGGEGAKSGTRRYGEKYETNQYLKVIVYLLCFVAMVSVGPAGGQIHQYRCPIFSIVCM